MCTTAYDSPSSNFTDCPALTADRRLIVRAQCGQEEFKADNFDNGKRQKRQYWGQVVSYLDACMTLIIFWVVLWMAEKEKVSPSNFAGLS